MARIYTVKKARASKKSRMCITCHAEIQVGDSYRYADLKTSPYTSVTRIWCSKHTPKASQMTTNDRLVTLYGAQENFGEVVIKAEGVQDVVSALEDVISEAESVVDEYNESADNMEEYFPGSSQVDDIRDKASSVQEWMDEMDRVKSEIENSDDLECTECGESEEAPAHQDNDSEDFDHEFQSPLEDAITAASEAVDGLSL